MRKNLKFCVALAGMIVLGLPFFVVNASATAPVLNVDAGVLPTSKLYFLDRFDEWAQENVFTFGIPSFRARAFLENASERVAELQFLNAQGMLKNQIANRLLDKWQRDLVRAATIVGQEYAHGRRPVSLTDGVVRTALASTDAIQSEYTENFIVGEERLFLPDDFLSKAEEKTYASIFAEGVAIPEAVQRLVVEDVAIDTQRIFDETKEKANTASGEIIHVGFSALVKAAEENQNNARDFYEKGDFQNSLATYEDARTLLRLASSVNFAIDPAEYLDKQEFLSQLEQILMRLTVSGLVEKEQINDAGDEALVQFANRNR